MQLNNFKRYEPDNPQEGIRVQYFISEDGTDFYESFNLFSKKYKIGFDENRIIRTFSEDISAIYPNSLSIVDIEKLPDDFNIDEKWVFINGKIARYQLTKQELIQQAEQNKLFLMHNANMVITPLQDAVDLNMVTGEEKVKLTEWKKYRVLLNRVDLSAAPDIKWPQKPV
ncbi:tail fiber assembly protein [Arsenophonus nasoniae]|uniref:Tail fiber assembly protein n=1 Tax=Arsenophonus nasoniae TaxID=638 RepID=A0AA95GTI2_9GAMM|nr:tail fiber assembly protein [Arsenophonus nasoniae]WGM02549.1 tail fiber assembly protein [Arsenophonus nasoniae]